MLNLQISIHAKGNSSIVIRIIRHSNHTFCIFSAKNRKLMAKIYLVLGSVLAGLGVILGAFGAHGLKQLVPPETVSSYQTGVQYQMYHAFALLLIGILAERTANTSFLNYAGMAFVTGVVLFSGSLYLMASLKAVNKVGVSGIGIVTPIGGLFFILGWILLLIAVAKR
jgi:uncharacterized membrane protein YgdD (TMEM256/DUF423 family)